MISLVAGLVGRIAVVAAMTYSTLHAVDRGGWFIALAALFVLSAIFMSAITAGAIWLGVTGRTEDDDSSPFARRSGD